MKESFHFNKECQQDFVNFKDFVNFQKKYIKRNLIIGMFYLILIISFIGISFIGISYVGLWNGLQYVCLGINITLFIYYVLTMINLVFDYKRDVRIVEWYETEYIKRQVEKEDE